MLLPDLLIHAHFGPLAFQVSLRVHLIASQAHLLTHSLSHSILAFIILFPLRFFVSTRIFHQVGTASLLAYCVRHVISPLTLSLVQINVYASRILNAPILIAVALYERRFTFVEKARHTRLFVLFKRIMSYTTVHGDLVTVFQLPPELAEVSDSCGRSLSTAADQFDPLSFRSSDDLTA